MTTLTNEESSIVLAKQAGIALLQSAGKDWENAQILVSDSANYLISACNLVRGVGLKLIEAAGHEQISFDFFRNNQHLLPKSLTFSAAKKCIHIARHFESTVSDMNEVRQVQASLFEAFGVTEPPHREVAQISHESNPWSDFVSGAANFNKLFDKIEVSKMQAWDEDRLKKFFSETKETAALHAKSGELLKSKGILQ